MIRRGAVAASLGIVVLTLAPGCVTPGVQGIQSDLDGIQEQLFRVQKENAELADNLASIEETARAAAAATGSPESLEMKLRIEAIERDLGTLVVRNDQTDQRLSALVQDLRATREALQSLLRAPRAASPAAGLPDGGQPDPDRLVAIGGGDPPPAAGTDPEIPGPIDAESALAMEDLYRQAYSDYIKGNYALALLGLEDFAGRYPTSDLADDALYLIGEVHFSQEDYRKAVESFDRVVQVHRGGDKAGPAYLKKGLSLLELNRTADAVVQLQHVIDTYPKSEEARIARDRLEGIGISER